MSAILNILATIFWFFKRFFIKKDANEPQTILDNARTDSATENDVNLNNDLDAANDRLRNKGSGTSNQ